jgi:hypothetical protein
MIIIIIWLILLTFYNILNLWILRYIALLKKKKRLYSKLLLLLYYIYYCKLYDPRLVIYAGSVIYEYNGIIWIYNDEDRKKIIKF